ncbi:hypothetical protein GCM10009855_18320 [Gordonia cholesterolivorans]|uniref:Uncharacterized protein n=1 Tax=Gordonia cholesterolivorans TaxID=559625 RepID=A0ABN3HFC5_9ACTN
MSVVIVVGLDAPESIPFGSIASDDAVAPLAFDIGLDIAADVFDAESSSDEHAVPSSPMAPTATTTAATFLESTFMNSPLPRSVRVAARRPPRRCVGEMLCRAVRLRGVRWPDHRV